MNRFIEITYWRVLVQNNKVVEKPENFNFSQPRAPIIDEKDTRFIIHKYNFNTMFNHPQFKGKLKRKVKKLENEGKEFERKI